ncbi:MAG: sugar transferase [Planctomycetaceae bacterium]|nr:sugar transferase [Planctomycetaceae bacterium]
MPSLMNKPPHDRKGRKSHRTSISANEISDEDRAAEVGEDVVEQQQKIQAFQSLKARPTPIWKRVIDCLVSGALVIVLAPLLILIAIYIRMVSRGPVFFTQPRLGLMGNEFTIYKFRTLKCSQTATEDHKEYVANLSATDSVLEKPDLSSRMIPGGKFLRQTSLDELPQLLNILQGSMSLVGPRPDVMDWRDYKPEQLRRFEVVPGVTGLWQVSGKNRLTFEQMIKKDVHYVDHRSLWLDLQILFKTFGLLLQRDNR